LSQEAKMNDEEAAKAIKNDLLLSMSRIEEDAESKLAELQSQQRKQDPVMTKVRQDDPKLSPQDESLDQVSLKLKPAGEEHQSEEHRRLELPQQGQVINQEPQLLENQQQDHHQEGHVSEVSQHLDTELA
jgi:hypothetical protein